jgi:uncharacterized membrane protein
MDFTTNFVVVGNLATAAVLSASGFFLRPFVYFFHEKAWGPFWLARNGVAATAGASEHGSLRQVTGLRKAIRGPHRRRQCG